MTYDARQRTVPIVLAIAGSDSGGGAGIQADLKTFQSLNVYGTCAITCITAQNPQEVRAIAEITPNMVAQQIKAVCDYFPVVAVKTGMLYSAGIIRAVAKTLEKYRIKYLVIDPVMISTSGTRLLRKDAVKTLCDELIPMATVITPNVPEAEILCGHIIASIDDMKIAARIIGEKFGVACVIKGGHLGKYECGVRSAECGRMKPEGRRLNDRRRTTDDRVHVTDVLYFKGKIKEYSAQKINAGTTHGTGCVFSAALTAFLARGERLDQAVPKAKSFIGNILKNY